MFELTMHFKRKMIGIWQRFNRNFELIKWNFELTVFELTVPDLYDDGLTLGFAFING